MAKDHSNFSVLALVEGQRLCLKCDVNRWQCKLLLHFCTMPWLNRSHLQLNVYDLCLKTALIKSDTVAYWLA